MPHKYASPMRRIRARPRRRGRILARDGVGGEPFAGSEDPGDRVREGVSDVGRDGPLVGEGQTVVVCDDGVGGGGFGWCE